MSARPKLQLHLTLSDKIIEVTGWLILTLLWILAIWSYSTLPDTIPVHFNLGGKVDGHGSKTTLFLLPVIGTVMLAGITILNRYPHIFNYPTRITEENALRQYTMATRMLRFVKVGVTLTFLILVIVVIRKAG